MPYCRTCQELSFRWVPPQCLPSLFWLLCTASPCPSGPGAYCWAVGAVAAIGAGAFSISFLALRDLMLAIGYSRATAWAFPAIIDTAVAVSTIMLVALGDKPSTTRPNPDRVGQYTTYNDATAVPRFVTERKNRGHTRCTDQHADAHGTS
jgi:hypothetical protein